MRGRRKSVRQDESGTRTRSLSDVLPSLDPCLEKKRLEKLGPSEWLISIAERRHSPVSIAPEEDRAAVLDIYRRCSEQAETPKARMRVVRDLAKYFPSLCVGSPWPASLLRGENAEQLLRALSDGFRGAGRRHAKQTLVSRVSSVLAARHCAESIRQELRTFRRQVSNRHRRDLDLEGKATEILHRYPKLHSKHAENFKRYVHGGQFYEAAATLAAGIFRVRERDVRSDPYNPN